MQEYYIPAESSSIHFLRSTLCVGCARGFEVVSLETTETQSLLDQADTSLDFVARKENVKPIHIERMNGEFLLNYSDFSFFVNRNGWRARPDWKIAWEGNPNAFALSYPYILAFEPNFVEIRHVETSELTHLMTGKNIRMLHSSTREVCYLRLIFRLLIKRWLFLDHLCLWRWSRLRHRRQLGLLDQQTPTTRIMPGRCDTSLWCRPPVLDISALAPPTSTLSSSSMTNFWRGQPVFSFLRNVQWSANTTSCVSATFPVSAPALCVSLFHRCISTLLLFLFLKFLSWLFHKILLILFPPHSFDFLSFFLLRLIVSPPMACKVMTMFFCSFFSFSYFFSSSPFFLSCTVDTWGIPLLSMLLMWNAVLWTGRTFVVEDIKHNT